MLRDPFQILSDQDCCWVHDFLFGLSMGHDLFGEPRASSPADRAAP
jgi:hypothetical protein